MSSSETNIIVKIDMSLQTIVWSLKPQHIPVQILGLINLNVIIVKMPTFMLNIHIYSKSKEILSLDIHVHVQYFLWSSSQARCLVTVVPLTSLSVYTTRRGTTWVPSSTTRDSWDRESAQPAVWHSIHTRYITPLVKCLPCVVQDVLFMVLILNHVLFCRYIWIYNRFNKST